ncbi:MAG: beta-lactamase family protein [Kofleriaceae bacterium]|nr:beta-lactamase family protein [Kofleriaceae bacterium]
MRRLVLLLVITACSSSAPTTPAAPKPKRAPAEQIETSLVPAVLVRGEEDAIERHTIEERMREYKIPAISIAVFDHYEIVWAKAYGLADVESQTPADEHTTFLAGSISKSVNALGQLTAVSDGLLALDAPINDQLVSWKLPDNDLTRAKPVTLRMLLSHTAGTTVHGFRGYAPGESVPTVPQILDGQAPANSAPIRVDLAPGTTFRYSGGGITISQLALADRAKKPYAEVLDERVLRPLGMTSSTFEQTLSPERLAHAAVGYGRDGKVVEGKRFAYPEMAAAGLWTTASDLARFFLEIAKARAGTSKHIPKALAELMTTKVISMGPDGVGLGVFLLDRNGGKYFGHNGADIGFQADALASLDPACGCGLVYMANSENGLRLAEEVERTIFAAYGWPGAPTPITRVALDAAQRAKFVGRYDTGRAPLEIVERGGKLIIRAPFMDGFELVPTGPDVVVNTSTAEELHLVENGLRVTGSGRPPVSFSPATAEHPLFMLEAGHFDEAVAALRQAKDARASEEGINLFGYGMLASDAAKATEILRLNVVAFPDSANVHDSYGEALATSGKTADAIAEYERVLALLDADPRLSAAERVEFKKHANEMLAKLRSK